MTNKNKGITLIALIVTIIILLIISGIGIAMITGDNGILNKVSTAKKESDQSSEVENNRLGQYNEYVDNYTTRGITTGTALKTGEMIFAYGNPRICRYDGNNAMEFFRNKVWNILYIS